MCDSIKNLELRDDSGSSEWTQCSHNILRKKRGRKQAKGKRRDDGSRIRYRNAVGPHTQCTGGKLEKARMFVLL